jgi:hypothetical protein
MLRTCKHAGFASHLDKGAGLVQYAAAQVLGAEAKVLQVTDSEIPLAGPSADIPRN